MKGAWGWQNCSQVNSHKAVLSLSLCSVENVTFCMPATGPCSEPDESNPQLPAYCPKIHSNIILPSMHRSSKRSLPFRFSNQNFVFFISSIHSACPTHLILFDLMAPILEACKLWSSSSCSLLQRSVLTTLVYVFPLVWETKFHIHTKQ